MDTDKTTEQVTVDSNGVDETPEVESISIPRKEYDTLNQTLGSLKKQLKDFKKAQEVAEETTEKTKAQEFGLLQKSYLRSAGIVDEEEVELAREIQEKTGMEWDKLPDDDYFQSRLKKFRQSRENVFATTNIKGGAESSEAKSKPEYWLAKGVPPMPNQVPNRKLRANIARAFLANAKIGKKFYDD
ncbi:MAG: hypothetical protein Q6360_13080 [Candidatus Brocadiales bacterium]|nr:hypothetical protein [Candidatus Brocadiales bacterium]